MCICWCVTEINYRMRDATVKIDFQSFMKPEKTLYVFRTTRS